MLQLCPILCDPVDCSPPGSSVHGIFPSKNTEVGCHTLLQGIFLTQESNQCLLRLLHCRQILYYWATVEAPFLYMGRWKLQGSLKSPLWYASQLPMASILCFLTPSLLKVCICGRLQWLMIWWWASGFILSSRRTHQDSCRVMAWWLQHLCLLIWQATFFFHWHLIDSCKLHFKVSN